MPSATKTTRFEKLRQLFTTQPLLRSRELREAGIAAQTIARAVEAGEIERISRERHQLQEAEIDTNQALAEIAKNVPKGIIAMSSALAYHGLTDQMPRKI